MALNPPSAYGRDIACALDADAFWSEAVGVAVVRQDAIHRLTTDDVLGDDGTGSFVITGWGFDTRRLLGMSDTRLSSYQPLLSEVLTRDPRIATADVTLTAITTAGLADVLIEVRCVTTEGPTFSIVSSVSALTTLPAGGAS